MAISLNVDFYHFLVSLAKGPTLFINNYQPIEMLLQISLSTGAICYSLYRVVVERDSPKSAARLRRRRESMSTPCGLSHSELVDHYRSQLFGVSCYVAAEMPKVTEGQLFVVGDNKTYGGYYNSPLDRGFVYHIWFGIVVTVDGVCQLSKFVTIICILQTNGYCFVCFHNFSQA